jgi:ADP-heptose:LPS heptosyltransferase
MTLKAKQFVDTYIGMPLVYVNMFFAKLLGKLLKRNHLLHEMPNEICVIKLLGFGSIIMASDAIYSIKKKYPTTQLTIICAKSIYAGIESLGLFDEIYIINDDSLLRTIWSSLHIVFKLQKRKCLWTLDLEVYSKLTSVLSLWTMAANRFGFYFNEVVFRGNLNKHNIFFNPVIQVEENYKRMIHELGINFFEPFFIPGFEQKNMALNQTHIAVNNTCSELSPERKMKAHQLAELINWIVTETHFDVALLGAPNDFETNNHFIETNLKQHVARIKNIAGVLSFKNYYLYLYNHCKMMITIDSAPLHIANKLNIPCISLWGPTTPSSRINVNYEKNAFVYLGVSCSPCAHFIDKIPCQGNNFCIQQIQLTQITTCIQSFLHE